MTNDIHPFTHTSISKEAITKKSFESFTHA
jgi:hypothetical protein